MAEPIGLPPLTPPAAQPTETQFSYADGMNAAGLETNQTESSAQRSGKEKIRKMAEVMDVMSAAGPTRSPMGAMGGAMQALAAKGEDWGSIADSLKGLL